MGLKRERQAADKTAKRAALAAALGDIVLAEGLDALSLRLVAARLGTSDRMLLYYFGSKANLIADTLASISQRLATNLSSTTTQPKIPPVDMIEMALGLLGQPETKPFMALWAEMVARAVRGDAIFREVVNNMTQAWIEWIEIRTEFPAGVEPKQSATAILAVIEGMSTFGLLNSESGDLFPILCETLSVFRS
ncbi:MAG: TetR/AcrR family transcriptional regulator [Acetobacter sp.]|jgi:AcrR family transcriptional regulator